jgi:mxaJ protein
MSDRSSGRYRITLGLAALLSAVPVSALSVCADPDYLPYSNQAGQGFENKVAETVAKFLGEKVFYSWASYRGQGGFPQFLSSTLDKKKCVVVMSIPYGSRDELTTRPYYVSSYVFVFPKSKNYSISSMDSPDLKKLKVGFESETPAQEGLKMRGMMPKAVNFHVGDDEGESPDSMLKALVRGRIDVLITWQPSISGFLVNYPGLDVVPIPNSRALGAPEQYSFPISMAVRTGDLAMKEKLDEAIQKHQAELESVLTRAGVRLFSSTEK